MVRKTTAPPQAGASPLLYGSCPRCASFCAPRCPRRNLALALALAPHLLRQREPLTQTLVNVAMSRRIDDPLRFVAGVLDHLPPVADDLHRYAPDILYKVYLQLALRAYAAGCIPQAREQLATAFGLGQDMPGRAEGLIRSLVHNALHLPVADPVRYVDTVLDNLPARAQALSGIRGRVLAEVHTRFARQYHLEGKRWAAVRHLLAAMRRHPSSTWNARTISFLFKALFGPAGQGTGLGPVFPGPLPTPRRVITQTLPRRRRAHPPRTARQTPS